MSDEAAEHIPPRLRELELAQLIGQTPEQARLVVEAAGGVLRTYRTGEALSFDYRAHRVSARVEHDHIVEVLGFG